MKTCLNIIGSFRIIFPYRYVAGNPSSSIRQVHGIYLERDKQVNLDERYGIRRLPYS